MTAESHSGQVASFLGPISLRAPLLAGLLLCALLAVDGAGRLKTVKQASPDGTAPNPVTTYGYDELGNKASQTDALGRITKWEYDALGRMTKRTLPGGQSETFAYDAVGNLATHTTFNGEVVTFTYDALNRLATKSLPAAAIAGATATTVTYTYTPTGQVATVEDTRGITRTTYDERDRVNRPGIPGDIRV